MPFSSSYLRSRGAIMILLPPHTGHLLEAAVPDPPQTLHFISIFLTSSLTFTSRVIFPVPLQAEQGYFLPPDSPVPLQCLHISPLRKLQTISPPVQNLSSGTHIQVLKSPPFRNGFFSSSLSPASPWRSQVIRLETSMRTSQACFIYTYFLRASSLSPLRSGWYLMERRRKAFLSSSLVAFSVTSSNSQRQVSRWLSTSTISSSTATTKAFIQKIQHVMRRQALPNKQMCNKATVLTSLLCLFLQRC